MKVRMKDMRICLALALAFTLTIMIPSVSVFASEAPARLVPPEGAHLTRAWISDDAPALMAWESTEDRRSGLVLYKDGKAVEEWLFDDVLVKDVRWLVPGETLKLGVVTQKETSESRVYDLTDGDLVLTASTAPLEANWDSLSLSPDGEEWAGARFGDGKVVVGAGTLADGAIAHEWELESASSNPPGPGVLEELNRVEYLETADGEPLLAVLWNGQIWMADPQGSAQVQLLPPGDCDDVRSFVAIEGGIWAQCYRGRGKRPAGLWGFYPAQRAPGQNGPAARSLGAFQKPWFRGGEIVVDLDRRRGRAEIHALSQGAESQRLGTVELPTAAARYLMAGDALLQAVEGTEEYLVIDLSRDIESLRARAPV